MHMIIPKIVKVITFNMEKVMTVLADLSSSSSAMDGKGGKVKMWCSGIVCIVAASVLKT